MRFPTTLFLTPREWDSAGEHHVFTEKNVRETIKTLASQWQSSKEDLFSQLDELDFVRSIGDGMAIYRKGVFEPVYFVIKNEPQEGYWILDYGRDILDEEGNWLGA